MGQRGGVDAHVTAISRIDVVAGGDSNLAESQPALRLRQKNGGV